MYFSLYKHEDSPQTIVHILLLYYIAGNSIRNYIDSQSLLKIVYQA